MGRSLIALVVTTIGQGCSIVNMQNVLILTFGIGCYLAVRRLITERLEKERNILAGLEAVEAAEQIVADEFTSIVRRAQARAIAQAWQRRFPEL